MDAQAAPTAPRPQVAVLAGINGAGKTSASESLLRESLKIPSFTNADTIARGLNAFDVESEAVKAGRIMLEYLHELAKARRSFAFETTLSGRVYARWLGELAHDGYAVHLFYYWLDSADLAVNRVAERVKAGGHSIPVARLRSRWIARTLTIKPHFLTNDVCRGPHCRLSAWSYLGHAD